MGQNGRYLRKKEPSGKKGKKIALIVVLALVLLLIAGGVFAVWFFNHTLDQVATPPAKVEMPTMSQEELDAMLGIGETAGSQPVDSTDPTETTSPLDTWPEIESDQNITNFMVVGQAARDGEAYRLSDSMILVSVNRDTKTLTMTSFQRDLRVTVPAYAGHSAGFNRMNVCYHLGSYYTQGDIYASMEMLGLCVEQNFGVPVDHTIEISFDFFEDVVDACGGIEIELTEKEAKHMTNDLNDVGTFKPGLNKLNGKQALHYARIRKIDNDFARGSRQRYVISTLINKAKEADMMTLYSMCMAALPYVVTDMTKEEMTDYIFEFLPMIADLEIVSQSVPFEGTYWYTNRGTEETPDYVIDTDLKKNGKMLRESIGMIEAAAE